MDQPERVAAETCHVRIDDREHGARRDRGIDRRAAGAQHVDARLEASACGEVTMPLGASVAGRPVRISK